MLHAAILFSLLTLQFEELVDPRTLALPHTGRVRFVSSETAKNYQLFPEQDGTLSLAKSADHAGSLARVWIQGGHPRAKVRAFIDGAIIPIVAERIGVAFEESRPPLLGSVTFHPSNAAGARVTYTPLRYRKNFNFTTSSAVSAFEVELVEDESLDPKLLNPEPEQSSFEIPLIDVEAGKSNIFALDETAGTLLSISFAPSEMLKFDLDKTRLRISIDGEAEPGIEASFASIFARPEATAAVAGGVIEANDKQFILRLPIPYKKQCKIEIVNLTDKNISLHGAATVNRDPMLPDTRRLVIREWSSGGASAGAAVTIGKASSAGHFVGFTMRAPRKAAPPVGKVAFESDGKRIYESVSLASAFDAAEDFLKNPHATVGVGISCSNASQWAGYCFRINRLIPFRREGRIVLESSTGDPIEATGAVFGYVEIEAAKPESKPADAQSSKH